MRKLLFMIPLLFCSCSYYKKSFDCPPCMGVGCKSVTEIEEMIIEKPDGQPDDFIGMADSRTRQKLRKSEKRCVKCKDNNAYRVWVEDTYEGDRMHEGHYVYFKL